MSNNLKWSAKDFKDKGLIEVNGQYVTAKSQVAKGKVEKLPNLLERAIPLVKDITDAQFKMQVAITKAKPNSKVKNATKTIVDEIKFDSKLESTMYGLLRGAGVTFDMQKVYILQPKFKFNGEAIRAIKSVVDFYLLDFDTIVDTKGYANDVSPIKYKMLKYFFFTNGLKTKIEMPKNEKECELLINRLKYT